jgi:hypothetical protein
LRLRGEAAPVPRERRNKYSLLGARLAPPPLHAAGPADSAGRNSAPMRELLADGSLRARAFAALRQKLQPTKNAICS